MARCPDNSDHGFLPSTVERNTMALSSSAAAPTVVIRAARGSDGVMLSRLAQLDSARVPAGDVLLAEADGAVVAAHAPATGATIADPFRRTAEVVELLKMRGAMMRAA
jgi:hypothetical protein